MARVATVNAPDISSASQRISLSIEKGALFKAAATDDVVLLQEGLKHLFPSSAPRVTAASEDATRATETGENATVAADDMEKLDDILDEDERTLLHVAAAAGNEAAVKLLLQAGADPTKKDEGGWTSLLSAASAGHVTVVRLLLDAVLQRQQHEQQRPHQETLQHQEEEQQQSKDFAGRMGETLQAVNADEQTKQQHNLDGKQGDIVRQFLEAKNPSGSTAINVAAAKGHTSVIDELLAAGADINSTDRYGRSALSKAVAAGKGTTVEYLLSKGADPMVRERFTGDNLLHLAVNSEDADICLLLMKTKAVLKFQKNTEGFSPFETGRGPFLKHLALRYEEEKSEATTAKNGNETE